jgi:predicted ArsR family transcriptional regulator
MKPSINTTPRIGALRSVKFEKADSNMRRVLVLMIRGEYDRDIIASELGISTLQVTSALYNLKQWGIIEVMAHRGLGRGKGRRNTMYCLTGQSTRTEKPATVVSRILAGVSSIFNHKG